MDVEEINSCSLFVGRIGSFHRELKLPSKVAKLVGSCYGRQEIRHYDCAVSLP